MKMIKEDNIWGQIAKSMVINQVMKCCSNTWMKMMYQMKSGVTGVSIVAYLIILQTTWSIAEFVR
jgi:hypothetical protein